MGGGCGNRMFKAGFTHPLCRQNPDPYFHRGCGTSPMPTINVYYSLEKKLINKTVSHTPIAARSESNFNF